MKRFIISMVAVFGLVLLPALSAAAEISLLPTSGTTVQPSTLCVIIKNNIMLGSLNNADVMTLQKFLYAKGYLKSKPTGNYGVLTYLAVKAYQRASGITPVSGFVGPITRASINTQLCGGATTTTPAISLISPTGGTFLAGSTLNILWNKNFDPAGSYYFVYLKTSPNQILGGTGSSMYYPLLFRATSLDYPSFSVALPTDQLVKGGSPIVPGIYYLELDVANANGVPIASATSNALTIASSTVATSNLIIGVDPSNPPVQTRTIGTNIPVLIVDAKSQNGDSRITSVTATVNASNSSSPTAAYLWDGTTLVDSHALVTGWSGSGAFTFDHLNILVPKDTTKALSVTVDMPGVVSGTTVDVSSDISWINYQKQDGTTASVYAGINGNKQTFSGSTITTTTGPQWSLLSATASTITSSQTGDTVGVTANFVLKVKPVGGSMTVPSVSDFNGTFTAGAATGALTIGSVNVAGNPTLLAEGSEYIITISGLIPATMIPVGTNSLVASLTSLSSTIAGKTATQTTGLESYKTNAVSVVKTAVTIPNTSSVDINNDGVVNTNDVSWMIALQNSKRGDNIYNPRADFNNDGVIDSTDTDLFTALYRVAINGPVVNTSSVDINNDGVVDTNDVSWMIALQNSKRGDNIYNIRADFNGDGVIDSTDTNLFNALYRQAISTGSSRTSYVAPASTGLVKGASTQCVALTQSLQKGSMDSYSNGEVSSLQEFLTTQGYGFPDKGTFGTLTETALKNWQTKKGISPTGITGPVTRQAISTISCQ